MRLLRKSLAAAVVGPEGGDGDGGGGGVAHANFLLKFGGNMLNTKLAPQKKFIQEIAKDICSSIQHASCIGILLLRF